MEALENLKAKRLERKLTQMDMCVKVGVSLPTYQLWERGITTPGKENLAKLTKVLKETKVVA